MTVDVFTVRIVLLDTRSLTVQRVEQCPSGVVIKSQL